MKEVLFPSLVCCIFKNERNLKIILQEISKELLIIYLNSQIQQFPYEKPIVSPKNRYLESNVSIIASLEKNLIFEDKKPEEKKVQIDEEKRLSTSEIIPSFNMIEEKKEEEIEEGIYSNYIRYVRDSQMKNEKKGPRSLSISSTNSSQNSCLISSSQHFSFPLRFPRQLWEDVVEFVNNTSEQQG